MAIILKNANEIAQMRRAGFIAAQTLGRMRSAVRAGVTTLELDNLGGRTLAEFGAGSSIKNYPSFRPGEGFPGFTVITVNEQVVNAAPCEKQLCDGDIVALSVCCKFGKVYADVGTTIPVGNVTPEACNLIETIINARNVALSVIRPGVKWSQVAEAIQTQAERSKYNVVREFTGHGISRAHHEHPMLFNYVDAAALRSDFKLRPGMTLAIMPIFLMGKRDIILLEDGRTVVTRDGKWSATEKCTVVVTNLGAEILTKSE